MSGGAQRAGNKKADAEPRRLRAVLAASGKESERVRALPAEVMTYYVIALGLRILVDHLLHPTPAELGAG